MKTHYMIPHQIHLFGMVIFRNHKRSIYGKLSLNYPSYSFLCEAGRLGELLRYSGPVCSKLTTSLVNKMLKFQTFSNMPIFFCWKNVRSFCTSLIFPTKNISVFGFKAVKHLMSWPLNELIKLTMLWTTGPWTIFLIFAYEHHDPFMRTCSSNGEPYYYHWLTHGQLWANSSWNVNKNMKCVKRTILR